MTCLNKHPLLTHLCCSIFYTHILQYSCEKWKLNSFSFRNEHFWETNECCMLSIPIFNGNIEIIIRTFLYSINKFWVLKEHYSFSHFHFKMVKKKYRFMCYYILKPCIIYSLFKYIHTVIGRVIIQGTVWFMAG